MEGTGTVIPEAALLDTADKERETILEALGEFCGGLLVFVSVTGAAQSCLMLNTQRNAKAARRNWIRREGIPKMWN